MSTVLVVDDEYVICELLELALEDAGYQVEKACNGTKALDVLKETRIGLLITDYMMPDVNGEELARNLRADPEFKTLPIILMSGAQANIGRESPGLFDGVLDKPFAPETLIAMVQQLLPLPGN